MTNNKPSDHAIAQAFWERNTFDSELFIEQDAIIARARAIDAQQPNDESTEPVAWLHKQGSHTEASERQLDQGEVARGWTQEPLYTHPPTRSEQLSEPSTDTPK